MFGSILLRDEGVEQKLDSIDRRASNVARSTNLSFSSMAGAALKLAGVLGGVIGFKTLGESALKGASDMEGYRNTLNIVMKDTKLAGETFAWAVDFANKTPFETTGVVDATVKLQSYGMKAREVLPAIGDMAGVMNKDLNQAVEAVADAQTGELERLKEFGITKQMIIDQGNKIMKGKELVNSKGQIVDQENFNQALFSLMNDRFKGGMDLQANSFKGVMSTISGVFSTSLAMMMGISATGEVKVGGMFESIKNKAKSLGDKLTQWSNDGTLEKIGNTIQTTFNIIVTVITVAFTLISNNIEVVKRALETLGAVWLIHKTYILANTAVLVAHNTVQGIKIALDKLETAYIWLLIAADKARAIATGAVTAAQWALNAAMEANPIGIVIALIVALVAGIVILFEKNKTFHDFVVNSWEVIKQVVSGSITAIKGFLKDLETAIELTKQTWNALLTWFRELPGKLQTIGADMFTYMKKGVMSTIKGVYDEIVKGVTTAIDWIKALPAQAMTWGSDFITGFKTGIMNKMGELLDSVRRIAEEITSYLHFSTPDQGPLADYESWMPDFMEGLAKGIDSNKFKVIDSIKGLTSDMKVKANIAITDKPLNSASRSAASTSPTSVDNSVHLHGDVNLPHIYDVSSFVRNMKAYARS